jgi:hypothetical protein
MKQQVSFPVSRGVGFLRNLAQLLLSKPATVEICSCWNLPSYDRKNRVVRAAQLE